MECPGCDYCAMREIDVTINDRGETMGQFWCPKCGTIKYEDGGVALVPSSAPNNPVNQR